MKKSVIIKISLIVLLIASIVFLMGVYCDFNRWPSNQGGTIWKTNDGQIVLFVDKESKVFYDASKYAGSCGSEYVEKANMYGYFIKDGEKFGIFGGENNYTMGFYSTKVSEREHEGKEFSEIYSEYRMLYFSVDYDDERFLAVVEDFPSQGDDDNQIFEIGTSFAFYRYQAFPEYWITCDSFLKEIPVPSESILSLKDFTFVIFEEEDQEIYYDARSYAESENSDNTVSSNMHGFFVQNDENFEFFVIERDGKLYFYSVDNSEYEQDGKAFSEIEHSLCLTIKNENLYVGVIATVEEENEFFEIGTEFVFHRYLKG